MPLHRIRAWKRYPTASGMATWSRDNMAVRYEQAVHIGVGTDAEEEPINRVIDEADGVHQRFQCDLPLMDELAAIDAFATLTAASVIAHAVAFPEEEGPGFVERHTCFHDEAPRQPCEVNEFLQVPTL